MQSNRFEKDRCKSKDHTRNRTTRRRSLFMESLEDRRLLAMTEIVFIDPSIWDRDSVPQALIGAAGEVVVLDASRDGIQQIADYLDGRTGIDAINILSHGDVGEISPLGNIALIAGNLNNYASQLSTIGNALTTDGDILLWGCGVAGADGTDFVQAFADATDADVAASNGTTGSPGLGGNWTLEFNTGPIEATNFFEAIDPQLALSHFRGATITHSVTATGQVTIEINSAWGSFQSAPVVSVRTGPSLTGAVIGSFSPSSTTQTGGGTELGGSTFTTRRDIVNFSLAGQGAGTYYATWNSNARVSGIQNPGGASGSWEIETAIVWDGVNASASPSLLPATIDIIAKGFTYS